MGVAKSRRPRAWRLPQSPSWTAPASELRSLSYTTEWPNAGCGGTPGDGQHLSPRGNAS